ncbi:MAG: hypothetical protein RIT45_1887 [Pseudomonadota bacterium]|jgi:uncharacterized membrane protein YdcZ (DUF606 family)
MATALLLTLLIGVSIVVQGGVNARLAQQANLWLLLTVGNVVCTIGSTIAWLVVRKGGPIGEELARVPWAVWAPSIAGFVIISGMPMAIQRIGVFRAVILVIAVQILAGLVWDKVVSDQAITATRLAGAALVFGGGLLVMRA